MAVVLVKTWAELQEQLEKGKVLLMASTTWCGPCKLFFPILQEVEAELSGKFIAVKANMDESPDLNSHLSIGSVPTLIYWKNGKEVHRSIGGCNRLELIGYITKYLLDS